MDITSEKCDIFSTPLFCLTLHSVSLCKEESPKRTSRNFPQPLVLQKGYYTSQTILVSSEFYNIWLQNAEKNYGNGETHSCRFDSSSTALCNREAERKTPTNKSGWFSEFQHIPRSLPEKRRTVVKHSFWVFAVHLLLRVSDVFFLILK